MKIGINYAHFLTKKRLVEIINTSCLPMCDTVNILRELLQAAESELSRLVEEEREEYEKMAAAEKTQASDSADSAVSEADAQTGPESTVASEVIPHA